MGAVSGVARKPAREPVYDAVMTSVWKQSPSSPSLIIIVVNDNYRINGGGDYYDVRLEAVPQQPQPD